MAVRKKPSITVAEGSRLIWLLAAILALSIGAPLIAGAVLRYLF